MRGDSLLTQGKFQGKIYEIKEVSMTIAIVNLKFFIYTTIYGSSLKINLYIVNDLVKLKIVKTLLDFL